MATSEQIPDENMSNEELKKMINVGKDKMSKSVAQTLNDESDINESFEEKVEVKGKDRESSGSICSFSNYSFSSPLDANCPNVQYSSPYAYLPTKQSPNQMMYNQSYFPAYSSCPPRGHYAPSATVSSPPPETQSYMPGNPPPPPPRSPVPSDLYEDPNVNW